MDHRRAIRWSGCRVYLGVGCGKDSDRHAGRTLREDGGELLVEREEVGDAVGVGVERLFAIEAIDVAVDGVVGLAEIGWHGETVVEIGEGGFGVVGACVEDALSEFAETMFLIVGGVWPGEIVVDDVFRIPVVALESPTNGPHPRHVHI